jgi:hypothetical protein
MKASKWGGLSGARDSITKLEKLMEDPVQAQDSTLLAIAATIYTLEGNELEALKIVHNPNSLELYVIVIIIILYSICVLIIL